MKEIVELFIEDRMWPDLYIWKSKIDKKQGGWNRFSTLLYDSDVLFFATLSFSIDNNIMSHTKNTVSALTF